MGSFLWILTLHRLSFLQLETASPPPLENLRLLTFLTSHSITESQTHPFRLDWGQGGTKNPLSAEQRDMKNNHSPSRTSPESLEKGHREPQCSQHIGDNLRAVPSLCVCLPRMALRMDTVAMGTRSANAKDQVSLFLGKIKSTLANQVDLESWLFQLDRA